MAKHGGENKYAGTVKNSQAESGTERDVKGVPHEHMSKEAVRAMHKPNHEFGPDRGGTDCHETHRGGSEGMRK